MGYDDVLRRVRRVLRDALSVDVSAEELERVERLDEVVGVDSLALVEFVSGLEAEFGVTLDISQLTIAVLTDLPALAGALDVMTQRVAP